MAIKRIDYVGQPGLKAQDAAGFGRLLESGRTGSDRRSLRVAGAADTLKWAGPGGPLAPATERARSARPERSAAYHQPLLDDVVQVETLPRLMDALRHTRNDRGVDGIEQLSDRLMLKTGRTTEWILRNTGRLQEPIEGFPLSFRTWPQQPQIHEVLVRKAIGRGAEVSQVFAIEQGALRALQNDLWRNIQHTDVYKEGFRSLID
ncbi:MAG TPA: hypothetical protein PLQ67_03990 [Burkholderiaceae bacterium]|nr:hypothetical protein [Burkholderiaceae bacterium]